MIGAKQCAAGAVYILSITAANWLVAIFGPVITPVNAFLLIGLDLTLRDYMHERIGLVKIIILSVVAGLLSWALNPAAGMIAVASSVSFVMAALADAGTYQRLIRHKWFKKANASNIAGAAVDSIVFPVIAFGALMPWVVVAQFAAKVAGGFLWTYVLRRGD